MQDPTTLFELDVLAKIRASSTYISMSVKPQIIGPDRNTVMHTINTL